MKRPVIMLSALVVAVAAASAVVVAAERPNPKAPAEQPAEAAGPDGKGTPKDSSGTKVPGTTGWTGGSRPPETGPSVGSRALTGADAERYAPDQPEMATGLDLKGPPVRFRAADTPE